MSNKVAEITTMIDISSPAAWIANMWDSHNSQRQEKIAEWQELRNYVFATDTSTTSNSTLPWKNSTTLPKLCQLRDNLHSNYISALFPKDNWMNWVAYSKDAATKKKASTIKAYMENKTREGHLRTEVSKLLFDYVDYGNAFVTSYFEAKYKEMANGELVPDYVGPRAKRLSPLDIVFNPTADTFDESWKIIRSVKTIGELKKLAKENPEQVFWEAAIAKRRGIQARMGTYSPEDFNKAVGYSVDGFGSLYEYYQSNWVEILEFYGDYHDADTDELHTNRIMTVVDRCTLVRDEVIPTWMGSAPIRHVGWRFRQDNLWAMGPLDNLVGMQYRIDHLENLKADAMDLIVHPPLKIKGEVEEFVWAPGAEIHLDENGDVGEVSSNMNSLLMANNEIQMLEDKMELYAGAPREAMGVRTPGEKTATEVNQLQNASGRIFQEKITHFEVELLEPLLNDMLETARRNMDYSDIIRITDSDLGVEEFLTITMDDIVANGKIRPVGARHFAKQAQDLQSLIGIFSSPIGQMIAPHTSGIAMTELVDDVTGLAGYEMFRPNVALEEQQETQALAGQAQEDNMVAMGQGTSAQAQEPMPQGMM